MRRKTSRHRQVGKRGISQQEKRILTILSDLRNLADYNAIMNPPSPQGAQTVLPWWALREAARKIFEIFQK